MTPPSYLLTNCMMSSYLNMTCIVDKISVGDGQTCVRGRQTLIQQETFRTPV